MDWYTNITTLTSTADLQSIQKTNATTTNELKIQLFCYLFLLVIYSIGWFFREIIFYPIFYLILLVIFINYFCVITSIKTILSIISMLCNINFDIETADSTTNATTETQAKEKTKNKSLFTFLYYFFIYKINIFYIFFAIMLIIWSYTYLNKYYSLGVVIAVIVIYYCFNLIYANVSLDNNIFFDKQSINPSFGYIPDNTNIFCKNNTKIQQIKDDSTRPDTHYVEGFFTILTYWFATFDIVPEVIETAVQDALNADNNKEFGDAEVEVGIKGLNVISSFEDWISRLFTPTKTQNENENKNIEMTTPTPSTPTPTTPPTPPTTTPPTTT
jgi:hypothetical protein